MTVDEDLARLEHRRLNGSSRLRTSRAPAASGPKPSQLKVETTETTSMMDTDDDPMETERSSGLQSQTKEDIKSKAVGNKRLKNVDGTASSVQSPNGSTQPSRPEPQLLTVPDTDPCHEKAAAAIEAARRSSSTKLFYMGMQGNLKVQSSQMIATRQLLAAILNSAYDFEGIKCGKGLKLNVIFVDAFGNKVLFPAISPANEQQEGSEVLPDGTSWLAVSSKAKAIYVCQDEYEHLNLPKQGVPPYSKLDQYGLQAPRPTDL